MESLPKQDSLVDEITAMTLRRCKSSMEEKGFAGKTIHNRLLTVLFLLKEHGIKNPLKWSDAPTIEEEPAVAYGFAPLGMGMLLGLLLHLWGLRALSARNWVS